MRASVFGDWKERGWIGVPPAGTQVDPACVPSLSTGRLASADERAYWSRSYTPTPDNGHTFALAIDLCIGEAVRPMSLIDYGEATDPRDGFLVWTEYVDRAEDLLDRLLGDVT